MTSLYGLFAVALLSLSQGGISLSLESESTVVDPARNVVVELELTAEKGVAAPLPDLRDRARGFSVAEDFPEPDEELPNGGVRRRAVWKFVPEPCAEEYKIAPFAVGEGAASFVAGPVRFEKSAPRETVTGDFEVELRKEWPPLSWSLAGKIALALAALAAAVAGIFYLVRFLLGKLKEHRMSPIERAWVELDRLLKRDLPAKGRYKDFYVELTLVVRRYVQRRHGVKAPHLTTEEFFDATRNAPGFPKSTLDELIDFLRKSDMVKFAGVEATIDTATSATESARVYIAKDDSIMARRKEKDTK